MYTNFKLFDDDANKSILSTVIYIHMYMEGAKKMPIGLN